MNLRPYQTDAIDKIEESLCGGSSALVVMPTGTGKTVVFAHAIRRLLRPGKRAMVIAHREELLTQAAAKIEAITGQRPDIEMAESRADSNMFAKSRVIVASVQTLISSDRLKRFDPREFGLLITDEAHHAIASSYAQVYEHMLSSGCKHLGVTATPDRSDEFALGKVYEEAPYVYELPDAVRDGWLVPIQQDIVRVTGLDYSNVKVTAGDLNQGDVAKAMGSERVLQGMCDAIVQLSGDKKAIVFATPGSMKIGNDKFHIADRVEEIFNRHKPGCAARVSQDTPKDLRREILNDYRNGKFQYLINVGVFTEGFDEPGVEIVAILRPTKSRSLYAQMVGRGTRPLPGVVDGVDRAEARRAAIANSSKPRVRVIDFAGNSGKHKLVTSADILGGNYEDRVVERAKQKAEKGSVDMQDALIEAMQEFRREDEDRKRRSKVIGKAEFVVQSIDPFDIFDISPNRLRGWEIGKGATPKQINMLSGFGIDGKDLTMGHASQLIDECMRRKNAGIVGFNQAMKLHEKGLSTDMSAAQASIALGGRLRSVSERWKEMESR